MDWLIPAGSRLLSRQVVRIPALVLVDVRQRKPLIAENAPVILDAEGKIPHHNAIHRALSALEAILVAGRE